MQKLIIFSLFFGIISFSNTLLFGGNENEITGLSTYYDVLPDINACNSGTLKESEKLAVLSEVNKIRAYHGLQPVSYDYSSDNETAQSALLSVANAALNHYPPTSYECYSQAGYDGASKSNLHINFGMNENMLPTSVYSIGSWMIDNGVERLGHRRAIINPFLKYISFGRCDGAPKVSSNWPYVTGMSLKVFFNEMANASYMENDYVAYPQNNYPPAYFKKDWFLSFTVINNKNNWWTGNGQGTIDFSQASIEVKGPNDNILGVYDTRYDYEGAGVPNCLKWKVSGMVDETRYNVTISNVKVNGSAQTYTYWFKLTDQGGSGEAPAKPQLTSPANSAADVEIPVSLVWNKDSNADSYKLEVATDQSFANKVIDQSSSSSSYSADLNPKTKYYWRVTASNSFGNSPVSDVWSFTTKEKQAAPSGDFLLQPPNKEEDTPRDPTFKWRKIAGATRYDLYVSKTDKFEDYNLFIDQSVMGDTVYYPGPVLWENTKYYWKLKATIPNSDPEWSEVYEFTTGTAVGTEEFETKISYASAYPNPFANQCRIDYYLPKGERIYVALYNTMGQELEVLVNEFREAGNQSFVFDAADYPSGVYFVRIMTAAFNESIVLEIIK